MSGLYHTGLFTGSSPSATSLATSSTTRRNLPSSFDPTADWRVWDKMEPIRIESARRKINVPDSVPQAKRRALTRKELAASGGAYTSQDMVWLVPVELVPHLDFKPADVVLDRDNIRWTALEAGFNTWRTWWRLVTRDLVLAFDLRDKIDIERASISMDASGAYVKAFPTLTPAIGSQLLDPQPIGGTVAYRNLAAAVHPEAEDVVDQRGIRGSQTQLKIYVEKQIVVNVAEDRIRWVDVQGKVGPRGAVHVLDMVHYQQADQIDQLPFITAVLKV